MSRTKRKLGNVGASPQTATGVTAGDFLEAGDADCVAIPRPEADRVSRPWSNEHGPNLCPGSARGGSAPDPGLRPPPTTALRAAALCRHDAFGRFHPTFCPTPH